MTVRVKIALLITTAGFLSSLVFSCIILWEMTEQPFHLIDADLESTGLRVAQMVVDGEAGTTALLGSADDLHYWLEVRDSASGTSLYRSYLARLIQITAPAAGRGVTIATTVPPQLSLGQDSQDEIPFRMRTSTFSSDGKEYTISAGRPMENLKEELEDTFTNVAGGLAFSVILLGGISYFVAGLILKPIREIDAQARDISEKHLDRRMPTSGDRDEFNSLAKTLNKVFDRLQHAFLRQKRLLADASHELKTPLTMIRLALDEIRSGVSHRQNDPHEDSHKRMTEQVLRMERLVKSLLDLSSLEIEAVAAREPVNLGRILSSLTTDYRFLGEVRGIDIDIRLPEPFEFKGDAEKLNRAFSNLLDNAIKYNEDGGLVTISGAQSNDWITVTIGNTGPGIPQADLYKIFEQFYRVEKSRSIRHGGSGLGLSIVKRIIELHGGTVQFNSRSEGWTTVTVDLPRHHEPEMDIAHSE